MRQQEPVIGVDQPELDEQDFGEIGGAGLDVAEVGLAVLECPPAGVGHAVEAHRRGDELCVLYFASIGRPSDRSRCVAECRRLLSQSKLYQSRRPWKYSSATSTFSVRLPSAVAHANAYSRRSACQASPCSVVVRIQLVEPFDEERTRVVCRAFCVGVEPGNAIRREVRWIFLQMKIERAAVHRAAGNGLELLQASNARRCAVRLCLADQEQSSCTVFGIIRPRLRGSSCSQRRPICRRKSSASRSPPAGNGIGRRSTVLSSGVSRSNAWCVAVRFVFRDLLSLNVDFRATGVPASSPRNSPICHCLHIIHNASRISARRARLKLSVRGRLSNRL